MCYGNPSYHVCDAIPGGVARSIVNKDDQTWKLSTNFICNGGRRIAPGEAVADLGQDYYYWN